MVICRLPHPATRKNMLIVAASLTFFIGIIHSYLGEQYILMRLFRRENIPRLFGSDAFTKGTLRFAWHITTIAWWGFGLTLLFLAGDLENIKTNILYVISFVFLASGLMSAGFTKGKHLSWAIFFLIAGLSMYAALRSKL